MRKIPNILGKYKTVAGAFLIAFLFAVPNVREVFAAEGGWVSTTGTITLTDVACSIPVSAFSTSNGNYGQFGGSTNTATSGWSCVGGHPQIAASTLGSSFYGMSGTGGFIWFDYTGEGNVNPAKPSFNPWYPVDFSSSNVLVPGSYSPSGGMSTSTSYFTSVTPTATTTATSTVLQQQGNIAVSDFASSTQIFVQYSNNGCAATGGFVIQAVNGSCSFSLTYAATSSGSFSFSTSTVFQSLGQWNYTATIENTNTGFCLFGFCPFSSTSDLAQVSGSFIVGTSTGYDNLVSYIASTSQAAVSAATLASTTVACDPFSGSFSIGSCITLLLVPNGQQMSVFVSSYSGAFLSYFPLGYVTRLTEIIGSSSPAEPPGISYTFGSSSPAVLQGLNYSINPFDYMGSTSPLNGAVSDDGQSRTIWQIVDPYFTMVTAFAVFGVILSDVLGVEISRERKKGRVNKRSSDDDY